MIAVLDRTKDAIADRVADLARRAINTPSQNALSHNAPSQNPPNHGKQPITRPIDNDDDLRACGLSSLGLVNLMLSVETEFDLKIPEREMTPANFRSIARIAELVGELSSRQVASE
jgi:acyl carrier protein